MSKLDNLTGTETLDELEAMLSEIEQSPDQAIDGNDPAETDVDTAPSAAAEGASGSEQGEDQPAGGHNRVVMAKNGQHTIPYEVLEQARQEAKQLREQLANAKQAQAERDKLQTLLDQHGIVPEGDPDEITQEQLEALAQDYPDIGRPLAAIARKLQALSQPAAVQPAANPLQTALESVPQLVNWRDNDPDRFDFAVLIDDKLKVDPAWSQKPLNERFQEAARRTAQAFGDKVDAPKTKDFIPSSPSALGQSHQTLPAGMERYGAMSQSELIGEMGAMSDAQMDALLEQAGL